MSVHARVPVLLNRIFSSQSWPARSSRGSMDTSITLRSAPLDLGARLYVGGLRVKGLQAIEAMDGDTGCGLV